MTTTRVHRASPRSAIGIDDDCDGLVDFDDDL
jgi:hypothetical protein